MLGSNLAEISAEHAAEFRRREYNHAMLLPCPDWNYRPDSPLQPTLLRINITIQIEHRDGTVILGQWYND